MGKYEIGILGRRKDGSTYDFSVEIQAEERVVAGGGDLEKLNATRKAIVLQQHPEVMSNYGLVDIKVGSCRER